MIEQLRLFASRIKMLKIELVEFAATVIEDNAIIIEDYNRTQLYDGMDVEGKNIEPEYTPTTKRIKRSKGQPTERVTYNDTGDLYKGIELQRNGNIFILVSTDEKTPKIIARSPGNKLIGIPSDKIEEFYDTILIPNVVDHAQKYLTGS